MRDNLKFEIIPLIQCLILLYSFLSYSGEVESKLIEPMAIACFDSPPNDMIITDSWKHQTLAGQTHPYQSKDSIPLNIEQNETNPLSSIQEIDETKTETESGETT